MARDGPRPRERTARDGDGRDARGGTARQGIGDIEDARVDRGAAAVGVGVRQREDTRSIFDEGEVILELAVIDHVRGGTVADREADRVRRAIDDEAAGGTRSVRVVRGERTHRLRETVEIEDTRDGGRERARRREDVRRADAQRTLGHRGAAGVRACSGDDDRVEALLGELTRAAETAEDFEDHPTGVARELAVGVRESTRVDAAIAGRDILADKGIAEELEADPAADGAVKDADVAVL